MPGDDSQPLVEWNLDACQSLFIHLDAYTVNYYQRGSETSSPLVLTMPHFWAASLFGRVAFTNRSLTITGTVSACVFRRFFLTITEKWLGKRENQTLCHVVRSSIEIPELGDDGCESITFWPFYAYLIYYDLYAITRISFYKTECEKFKGHFPVNRIVSDYLNHFAILSQQIRATDQLPSPFESLTGLFAANMGLFLDSQGAIKTIQKFPLETAVNFFSR
jgi:hypothetical protein